jgi:hypothetical protein
LMRVLFECRIIQQRKGIQKNSGSLILIYE